MFFSKVCFSNRATISLENNLTVFLYFLFKRKLIVFVGVYITEKYSFYWLNIYLTIKLLKQIARKLLFYLIGPAFCQKSAFITKCTMTKFIWDACDRRKKGRPIGNPQRTSAVGQDIFFSPKNLYIRGFLIKFCQMQLLFYSILHHKIELNILQYNFSKTKIFPHAFTLKPLKSYLICILYK